jgi:hypothetical protein
MKNIRIIASGLTIKEMGALCVNMDNIEFVTTDKEKPTLTIRFISNNSPLILTFDSKEEALNAFSSLTCK